MIGAILSNPTHILLLGYILPSFLVILPYILQVLTTANIVNAKTCALILILDLPIRILSPAVLLCLFYVAGNLIQHSLLKFAYRIYFGCTVWSCNVSSVRAQVFMLGTPIAYLIYTLLFIIVNHLFEIISGSHPMPRIEPGYDFHVQKLVSFPMDCLYRLVNICMGARQPWAGGGAPLQEEAGHETDTVAVAIESELGVQASPPPYDYFKPCTDDKSWV